MVCGQKVFNSMDFTVDCDSYPEISSLKITEFEPFITELVSFKNTFEFIRNYVVEKSGDNFGKLIIKAFDYNVLNGKQNRGMSAVMAYHSINEKNNSNVSEKNIKLNRILGWVLEIVQASCT